MTQTPEELTEEWYSKKLQTGSFWFVETKDGYPEPMVVDMDGDFEDYEGSYYSPSFSKGKLKVLAPCNYNEYKAMQDHILYLEKCISIYEQKEKLHTNDSIEYNKLEKENNNLRALLRECKQHLYFQKRINNEVITLLIRINAALDESEEIERKER